MNISHKTAQKTFLTYLLLGFLTSCGHFKTTPKEMSARIQNVPNTKIQYIKIDEKHSIRTVWTAKDTISKPTLIFIHGTPGGAYNFLKYHSDSSLQEKYNILSYDRPGFGYKDKYHSLPQLLDQAQVLNSIIKQMNLDKISLYSHSFGGAIALQTALLNPKKIEKIILVAVAIDPKNEKYFWYGKVSKWKITKWMLPKALRVSGDEKYTHVNELQKLEPQLANIQQKVLAVHGTGDSIVPYINLKYINEKLINAELSTDTFEGANHFLPSGLFEYFKNKLLEE